ncbi:MAG: TIGR02266 family protein [Myxococcales bacterium]
MDRAPLVFPVRFAAGDTAVQTTTRELSDRGVMVSCLEPPPEGTTLDIRLYLPGARQAVQFAGVVRQHSNGGEPGFWADFIEPGEEQVAQIGEVIARRERAADAVPIGVIALHPHADPRRSFPRVNVRFAVRFATVQDFVLEYAANISAGGVFVLTENPPPLKTVVQVELELPGGGGPVQARCMVVHRVTKQDAQQRGGLPGVGVQFMDADDEFRRRIDDSIAHILETEQRSA